MFNPGVFKRLEKQMNGHIQRSLEECGTKILQDVDNNFRNKSYYGEKWEKNIFDSPTLVASGRLRASVRVLSRTKNRIKVGTEMKYADIHNEGGSIRTSPKQERYFWSQYKKTGNEKWKNLAIASNKKGSFEIPKRQFIGLHPRLLNSFRQIIKKNTENKVFK